jgi:hypothetical protein
LRAPIASPASLPSSPMSLPDGGDGGEEAGLLYQ